MTSQLRTPLGPCRGKLDPGKTQTKIQLIRTMLRNRRISHQELCNHEDFLSKLTVELMKAIQDMEESSAMKVRVMLQQQDVFSTIINILECSNQKKLQQMKCELQEWEEKEESKIHNLEQQVEQLNAKIEKTHEELSFVSTYKDREYPIKSVQVADLGHQLQQMKESQQDELEDLREVCRMVLASMSNQIQKKKKKLLRSLVVKIQHANQEALLYKTWNSQAILKCMGKFREAGDFSPSPALLSLWTSLRRKYPSYGPRWNSSRLRFGNPERSYLRTFCFGEPSAPRTWTLSSTSLWKSRCPSRCWGLGPPFPPVSSPAWSLEFSPSKTTPPFSSWSAVLPSLPPSLLSGWCCYLGEVGILSQVLFTNKP
ncbi:uncharacterized protein C20orf96 homolog isoform X3 [Camelus ferus]|nr:uncharacterized protein C20orf96 homolog isoform X3 [Camelus ferus]XP_032317934.1 uncharacterized protein C20orf96 homolog isoform X3 [Camelus ferus]